MPNTTDAKCVEFIFWDGSSAVHPNAVNCTVGEYSINWRVDLDDMIILYPHSIIKQVNFYMNKTVAEVLGNAEKG